MFAIATISSSSLSYQYLVIDIYPYHISYQHHSYAMKLFSTFIIAAVACICIAAAAVEVEEVITDLNIDDTSNTKSSVSKQLVVEGRTSSRGLARTRANRNRVYSFYRMGGKSSKSKFNLYYSSSSKSSSSKSSSKSSSTKSSKSCATKSSKSSSTKSSSKSKSSTPKSSTSKSSTSKSSKSSSCKSSSNNTKKKRKNRKNRRRKAPWE